jgi:hypothetical protein
LPEGKNMATTVKLNADKLKRLIHYAAYRCIDRPHVLDAVKMNKVLWYSDQAVYLATGTPLTGEKYIKKPMGPVSSNLRWIVEELEDQKAIAMRQLSDDEPVHYLALTRPDMSTFSGEEMRMVEDAIDLVCVKNTSRSISQKSHDIVWKLANLNDEIPYYAIHGGRLEEIDAEDVEWAMKELAEA